MTEEKKSLKQSSPQKLKMKAVTVVKQTMDRGTKNTYEVTVGNNDSSAYFYETNEYCKTDEQIPTEVAPTATDTQKNKKLPSSPTGQILSPPTSQ